jgi:hypothetical protein
VGSECDHLPEAGNNYLGSECDHQPEAGNKYSNIAIDLLVFTFYSDQLSIDVETGIVKK